LAVTVWLASGQPTLDPTSWAPQSVFVTDADGYFRVRLQWRPDAAEETLSAEPDGGEPLEVQLPLTGQLSLAASRQSLGWLEPAPTTLTLTVDGRPAPTGAEAFFVFDPDKLDGLPTSAFVGAGGAVFAPALQALRPTGPLSVLARLGDLTSNSASFEVSASGVLSLSASVDRLEWLTPERVVFEVRHRGQPLPAGTVVALAFAADDWAGLPSSATVDADGRFAVEELAILRSDGRASVQVSAAGLSSNAVDFEPFHDPDALSFEGRPDELELFVPSEAAFVFRYRGRPLPAGVAVALTADPGELENLPAAALTGPGGKVETDGLTAIRSAGPLLVTGAVLGCQAGQHAFGVRLEAAKLSATKALTPIVIADRPPLFEGEVFVKSCLPFQATMTLSYRGRALADAEVEIEGFAVRLNGPTRTDQLGRAFFPVQYSNLDRPAYQVDNQWRVKVGDARIVLAGPTALSFNACY
jgi:hypothetical protein